MTQEILEPTEIFGNHEAEKKARAADPRFDKAMNGFWREYHLGGRELHRCVQAALKAADGPSDPIPEIVNLVTWAT